MVARIDIEDVGAGIHMQARGLQIVGASVRDLGGEIAGVTIPLLQGTAAPNTGNGVVHAMPCLYVRLNGSTSELWIASGTAPTAWTQVTVP